MVEPGNSIRSSVVLGALLVVGCGGEPQEGAGTAGGTEGATSATAGTGNGSGTSTATAGGATSVGSASAGSGSTGTATATATAGSATAGGGSATGGASATAGSGGSGGATAGTGGSTGSICADQDVTFDVQTPTVVLLIDQSGSMTANFGNTSRWEAVRDALTDPVDGVVAQLASQVRFGLTLYTSFDGFDGGTCPVLTEVPPALDNYQAIADTFAMNQPEEDTPTGESIEAVTQTLLADPWPDDKIIVLATDGEPDTCAVPDPQNGQAESIAAAQAAFNQGIKTFIIGVGNQVSQQHLQDMANAGQGVGPNDPDAPYYQPANKAALVQAFEDIINGVRSCVLTLNGMIVQGMEESCTVTVNGMDVPFDDPNGWKVNSPSEIELVGQACDAIQEGTVEIDVVCTCDAIIPQ